MLWLYDSSLLTASDEISFACSNMETIIIRDLSLEEDAGQYRCFSTNPSFTLSGILILTGEGVAMRGLVIYLSGYEFLLYFLLCYTGMYVIIKTVTVKVKREWVIRNWHHSVLVCGSGSGSGSGIFSVIEQCS